MNVCMPRTVARHPTGVYCADLQTEITFVYICWFTCFHTFNVSVKIRFVTCGSYNLTKFAVPVFTNSADFVLDFTEVDFSRYF